MMKMKELMNKEGMKNLFKNKKLVVGIIVFVVAFTVYMYNKFIPEIDVEDIDNKDTEEKE